MTPLVGIWIACGILALAIGSGKKIGAGFAFVLGFLLGPLGLIIVALSGRQSTLDKVQARPDAAGWHPDPLGRFDGRYFDGKQWTQHVGRVDADGTRRQLEDPI